MIFKDTPEEKQQLVEGKNADNISESLNHSFSSFENSICVLVSTKSTVLIHSV